MGADGGGSSRSPNQAWPASFGSAATCVRGLAAGADGERGLMVSVISGMSAVLDRYDGFILDIWGVLHDGRRPYAGVLDCLARLRDAGKRTCLLSNAPRRNDVVVVALERMGIGRHCYDLV